MILGCYVDDLWSGYTHDDEHSLYHQFIQKLQSRWEVEDEGPVRDLLGVEIAREGKLVTMRQKGYIERMAQEQLSEEELKTVVRAPCDEKLEQRVEAASSLDMSTIDPVLVRQYQGLVGALLYASINTRPDIAFAVGQLSRVTARPTPEIMEDAKRVLAYLYHCLLYTSPSPRDPTSSRMPSSA